jgi:hypothetical protein
MGRLLRVRSQGGVFTTTCRRGPEVGLWEVCCRQMPSRPKVPRSRFLDREPGLKQITVDCLRVSLKFLGAAEFCQYMLVRNARMCLNH